GMKVVDAVAGADRTHAAAAVRCNHDDRNVPLAQRKKLRHGDVFGPARNRRARPRRVLRFLCGFLLQLLLPSLRRAGLGILDPHRHCSAAGVRARMMRSATHAPMAAATAKTSGIMSAMRRLPVRSESQPTRNGPSAAPIPDRNSTCTAHVNPSRRTGTISATIV